MIYFRNHNLKIKKKSMKKILTLIILSFTLLLSFWNFNTYALWGSESAKIPYCKDNNCGVDVWVELVKRWVIDVETEWKATDKIQEIVKYLLTFITLIAFIYVVYSWFRILTSSGEDETIKNAKKTIIYVIVWILVIWFAWAIANFAVIIWTAWK